MRGTDRIICACLSSGMSVKEINSAIKNLVYEYGRYECACECLYDVAAAQQIDCQAPEFVDDRGESLEWGDGLHLLNGEIFEEYNATQEKSYDNMNC